MWWVPPSPMCCARLDVVLSEWRGGRWGDRSKAIPQLGHGQMGLAQNRPERTTFQSFAVTGHGEPDRGVVRVLEVVVAPPAVVHSELDPIQGSDQISRRDSE